MSQFLTTENRIRSDDKPRLFVSGARSFNEVLTDGQDFKKKPFLRWNPGNLYSSDKSGCRICGLSVPDVCQSIEYVGGSAAERRWHSDYSSETSVFKVGDNIFDYVICTRAHNLRVKDGMAQWNS